MGKHVWYVVVLVMIYPLTFYRSVQVMLDCYYWFYKATFEGLPDITFWRMCGMLIPINLLFSKHLVAKADKQYQEEDISTQLLQPLLTPVALSATLLVAYFIHIWS